MPNNVQEPYEELVIRDFIGEHKPPYVLACGVGYNEPAAILDCDGEQMLSTEQGIYEKDLEAIAIALNIAAKKIEGEK